MKVFINPGHGLKDSGIFDPGALGSRSKEADINFKISNKLNLFFWNAGIEATLYQDGDRGDVVKKANASKCDYFISVHCNAFSDPEVGGTETLIVAKGGKAEVLAEAVQAKLVRATLLADRGVKVRPLLQVLKDSDMPAILVETAFITNPAEQNLLMSDLFQTTIAKAIFEGFCEATGYAGQWVRERCQKVIQDKCKFSNPDEVWEVLNTHAHADAVYQKLAVALQCK